MKVQNYWIYTPLFLAACGESTLDLIDAPEIEVARASESNAEKIARAEERHGKPFHQMSLEERAEVLAAEDLFGNKVSTTGATRSISRAERRAILRREQQEEY